MANRTFGSGQIESRNQVRIGESATPATIIKIKTSQGSFRTGFFFNPSRTNDASAGRSAGFGLRHSRIVRSHLGSKPGVNRLGAGGREVKLSAEFSNGLRPVTISYSTTPSA